MDTQKIEPLLMDYALGATSAEVSALIEAFQERDADVQACLRQWQEIADLTRRATAPHETVAVPVFPRSRLQTAQRTAQRRRTAVRVAALAACLLLGYLIGTEAHGRPDVASLAKSVPMTMVVSPASADVPVATMNDFWSQSRLLAAMQRTSNRQPKSRSSWNAIGNLWVLFHPSGG
jgi:anti-sigma-K factor RskA